jgi:hypothetical protein
MVNNKIGNRKNSVISNIKIVCFLNGQAVFILVRTDDDIRLTLKRHK